jgi:outer membrane protein OmpA-like peptidoglycan-associated protein
MIAQEGERSTGVAKRQESTSIKTNMSVSVICVDELFDKNTNAITATGKNRLLQVCSSLVQRPHKVEIFGYTDNQESYLGANFVLSRTWAKNVANFFAEKRCFIEADVVFNGLGSAKAVASNANEIGRAANRRVEIVFQNATKQ